MPFPHAPNSNRWVVIWPGWREVHQNFASAREDLLNMLWWWARDFEHANPELFEEIMDAWTDIATADEITTSWTQRDFFKTQVGGESYILVRHGKEADYGVRDPVSPKA